MHAAPKRESILTRNVSCVLTEDEANAVDVQVRLAGSELTKSQWVRGCIQANLNAPMWARAVLAEVMSLRTIVVAVVGNQANGTKITEDLLREIQKVAESEKLQQADKRIEEMRETI